jgi:hypothetical protein
VELLPSAAGRDKLIIELKSLLHAHGYAPFVSAPLLEPRAEHFPDTWRADALGVERMARRLLIYAGLPDLTVNVELFQDDDTEWPAVIAPRPVPFDTAGDPPPPDLARAAVAVLRGRHEGVAVFRVARSAAALFTAMGMAVGLAAAVAVAPALSGWGAVAVFVAIAGASRALGARRRHDRCSESDCEARLPEAAARCPGCGGTISGRIAKSNDRLAAREALEDSHAGDGDGQDDDGGDIAGDDADATRRRA